MEKGSYFKYQFKSDNAILLIKNVFALSIIFRNCTFENFFPYKYVFCITVPQPIKKTNSKNSAANIKASNNRIPPRVILRRWYLKLNTLGTQMSSMSKRQAYFYVFDFSVCWTNYFLIRCKQIYPGILSLTFKLIDLHGVNYLRVRNILPYNPFQNIMHSINVHVTLMILRVYFYINSFKMRWYLTVSVFSYGLL